MLVRVSWGQCCSLAGAPMPVGAELRPVDRGYDINDWEGTRNASEDPPALPSATTTT